MRPVVISRQLATADPDGIVDGGSVIANGTFTLNGALVTSGVGQLGQQRKVLITSALNLSAVNFTINGTNQSGVVISEILAGPNATTAESLRDYLTVTSITADALAGVHAVGTLTLTGLPLNTETVTLGGTVYTFLTVLVDTANNVLIGASAADSIDNLLAAISAGAGAGTLYGTGTVVNADATGVRASDTMVATAILPGTAGNAIVSTETLTNGSWGNATLITGADGADIGTSANGGSAPIMIDRLIAPTNIGLAFVLVSGAVTGSVQHTFDDANDLSIIPTWFIGSINLAVISTDGNLAFPPRFVRLNTSSGTGLATLTVIQAGYS